MLASAEDYAAALDLEAQHPPHHDSRLQRRMRARLQRPEAASTGKVSSSARSLLWQPSVGDSPARLGYPAANVDPQIHQEAAAEDLAPSARLSGIFMLQCTAPDTHAGCTKNQAVIEQASVIHCHFSSILMNKHL